MTDTPTLPDNATLTVQLGPFLADLGASLGVLLADHLPDPLPLVDAVAHAAYQALLAHRLPGPTTQLQAEIARVDQLVATIMGDDPKPGMTARTLQEISANLRAALPTDPEGQ